LGAYFLSLFLIAIGAGIGYWQMPGLQHDWTISRNPVVVYDGDVQNGECTTRKAIFVDCSAHLSYVVDGQRYETDTSLMFVDFHSGDYEVDVVRSGDKPELATMSIGIDKLWNRAIFFLFLLGFTLGLGVYLFARSLGAKRAVGLMAGAGKLQALEVVVTSVAEGKRGDAITFQNTKGARPKAKFISTIGKKETALMWAANGATMGYEVQHQATHTPVLRKPMPGAVFLS